MVIIALFLIIISITLSFVFYFKKPSVDLVIARYNESIDWLNQVNCSDFRTVFVYNKGQSKLEYKCKNVKIIDLPNVGRCDHTYLYHIIQHYHNLADVTVFLPASCPLSYKWKFAKDTIHESIKTKNSVFFCQHVGNIEKTYADFKLEKWKAREPANATLNPEENLELCPDRPFGKWYSKNFPDIHGIEHSVFFGIFSASKKHIRQRSLQSYKELIQYLDHHSNPEAGHYFERAWLAVFNPVEKSCIR